MSLRDMIQKDRDTINRLIELVKEVKSYTDALGQIEVLRERLWSMDLCISELQMRPSTQGIRFATAMGSRLYERIRSIEREVCRRG